MEDNTKNGNNEGITLLIHSSIPSAAPARPVLLSKISISIPRQESIAVQNLLFIHITQIETMRVSAKTSLLVHMLWQREECA